MSSLIAALDIAESVERAPTALAAGRALFDKLRLFGARSLFAGSFPKLPATRLDDMVRGREVFAQFPVPGWLEAYGQRRLDRGNPVILAIGGTFRPFRWSDGGVPALRGWAGLGLARELGLDDGLAVPCHRPDARVGVVSVGFERFDLSPREARALHLATLVTHERMYALSAAPKAGPVLSARERDCIAYVAEGHGDAEIAARLGISASTAHTHIENAKRKLAATTRAQAVARFYALGLF